MKNYIFLVCILFTAASQEAPASEFKSTYASDLAAIRAHAEAQFKSHQAAFRAESAEKDAEAKSTYSKEAWAIVEKSNPMHKKDFQLAFKEAYAAEKSAIHARNLAEQRNQEVKSIEAHAQALARAHAIFH